MFVNTSEFRPVPKYGITREDPRSLAYQDWWVEERRRCIEGYSVGGVRITGEHYWYLNYWKIRGLEDGKSSERKGYINPKFLDMDWMFFNEVEKARALGKNLLVLKCRQRGFSEKAASMMGREFSLFPFSQSIITAGEDKYAVATTRMLIRGLNQLDGTEFYKRRNPDTIDYMQARYKTIENGIIKYKGIQSEFYNVTSKNNVQSLIGKQPSFVYLEEAGRFKGVKEVYNYIQPALKAEGKKTGFCLLVGTGGEMEQGARELSEMFYDPDTYDLMTYDNIWDEDIDPNNPGDKKKVCYFVPAYYYELIDSEGNSLIKESREKIHAEREIARKSTDPGAYYNLLTQRPETPSEALLITGGNIFNQALLNARLSEIRRSKELSAIPQHGDLEWKKEADGRIIGVEWKARKEGRFCILEHPELDSTGHVYRSLYIAGTDSYDFDAVGGKYGSQGSCSIRKKFLNSDHTYRKFVARLTERPKTAIEFYEDTAKLCMYYGGCKNLIEYSNLRIFDWYKSNSFTHLLKERPKIAYANVKASTAKNPYGIHAATKEEWLTALRDDIEDFIDQYDDPVQIEALIKFKIDPEYNCDITISSALAVIHDVDDRNIKAKESIIPKFEPYGYSNKNGRLVHGIA